MSGTKRNKYLAGYAGGMTLYIIGIGLSSADDITVKGLKLVKGCSKIWLENYTSILQCGKAELEKAYGKKVELADREMVEKGADEMLALAAKADVALLVIGDPMSATTHTDLMLRAAEKGVKVEVIHNASVLTAVGVAGLELYKYGKTPSIVFPDESLTVQSHYDCLKDNQERGLHTLCLLDIKVAEPTRDDLRQEKPGSGASPRFMTVNQAIQNLLDIEEVRKEGVFGADTLVIGCARLGSSDRVIKAGKAASLLDLDFGGPLHCLIVPGKLHFVEEEALGLWK
jgi:diphthine synthase